MCPPEEFEGAEQVRQTAKMDFDEARRKGFWRSVSSWFSQESTELLPFDEVRKRLPYRGEHYIGLREIELEKVVGSVSRYVDFDSSFLPRQTNTRDRWESVDRAILQDVYLPPIEVYKIGEVYFVKDGNHRVSVARGKGQIYIDAFVIEIDSPIPLGSREDLQNLVLLEEKAQFYQTTNLAVLRPDAKIDFTVAGRFDDVFEHISTHRWFMGEELKREIPYFEAVTDWYDGVYKPLVEIIRQKKILNDFHGRTEADLYLWIIEHLWYLREEYKDITPELAASHFAEEYSQQPIKQIVSMIRNAARTITGEE